MWDRLSKVTLPNHFFSHLPTFISIYSIRVSLSKVLKLKNTREIIDGLKVQFLFMQFSAKKSVGAPTFVVAPPPPPFWEIQDALLKYKRMLLKTLRLIACNNPPLPPYIPVADAGFS